MATLMRLANWTVNVWPDFFVGLVMMVLGGVLLGSGEATATLTIAKDAPDVLGYGYIVAFAVTGAFLSAAIWQRRPLIAARAAGVGSLLFAANAVAIWATSSDSAAVGCAAYIIASMLMFNRMSVLRYARVSPPWVIDAVKAARSLR